MPIMQKTYSAKSDRLTMHIEMSHVTRGATQISHATMLKKGIRGTKKVFHGLF
jgi:hypothetical protein